MVFLKTIRSVISGVKRYIQIFDVISELELETQQAGNDPNRCPAQV